MKAPTSIYRQHAGLVYAVADPVDRINRDAPAEPEGSLEFVRQRRAAPVLFLLLNTQEWLDSLPRRVQPYVLCKLYPRITNQIAAKWTDMKALSAYFDDLLVDRRRGRRGFPLEVLNDLCVLREYHSASHHRAAVTIRRL
ncbi:MAG TPA: hypothetical protein VN326_14700 [Casimicrobiaceae bacterium]|jgi:hypothetical protein|nr:hypothetical protein [Casimicrobiaceae bacterium]